MKHSGVNAFQKPVGVQEGTQGLCDSIHHEGSDNLEGVGMLVCPDKVIFRKDASRTASKQAGENLMQGECMHLQRRSCCNFCVRSGKGSNKCAFWILLAAWICLEDASLVAFVSQAV